MKPGKEYRICIIGNSGTGKSTLAAALAYRLNIPAYHLDRELLHDQFIPYTPEEQRNHHANLIRGSSWVIDGNYRSLLPDRLKRANLVIFLNVSRFTAITRVIRRYLKNSHLVSSVPKGAKNGMSWAFIKWVLGYSRKKTA